MSLFQVSDEKYEREVTARDGSKWHIWLREMSADDADNKLAKMIQFRNAKGDANSARVDMKKSRRYEIAQSLVDWDFTTDGKALKKDGANKLEISPFTISRLPESIYDQINDHIRELNELPEDADDEYDENGDVVAEGEENPT